MNDKKCITYRILCTSFFQLKIKKIYNNYRPSLDLGTV